MAIRSMAVGASRRRASIQPNRFSILLDFVFVALSTGDFVVGAVQRELGLVVIEHRRSPAFQIVAGGAFSFRALAHELSAVNILVASRAFFRCVREVHSGFG